MCWHQNIGLSHPLLKIKSCTLPNDGVAVVFPPLSPPRSMCRRIGRLVFRAALDNPDCTVVAVNDANMTIDYAAYQVRDIEPLDELDLTSKRI